MQLFKTHHEASEAAREFNRRVNGSISGSGYLIQYERPFGTDRKGYAALCPRPGSGSNATFI